MSTNVLEYPKARNLKFLFCGNLNTTSQCCCGCSLYCGSLTLVILNIIFEVFSLIITLMNAGFVGFYIVMILFNILYISLYSVYLIGACQLNFKMLYPSYIFMQILLIGNTIIQLIYTIGITTGFILVLVYDINENRYYWIRADSTQITITILGMIFSVLLGFYFLYVHYSFTKNVGLGRIDYVNGNETGNAQQVSNNNYYIPPNNVSNIPVSTNPIVQP